MRNKIYQSETRPLLVAILIAISVLFFLVVIIRLPTTPETRSLVFTYAGLLVGLVTTIYLLKASNQTKKYSQPISRAWLFLGYAQMVYFLGDLIWGIMDLYLHIAPSPSIADIPYLMYYPLFFYAVMQFPSIKRRSYELLKRFLDLAILVIGGIIIFWNYILGPITQIQSNVPLLAQILAYAYPVGDLILFWAMLLLLYNRIQERNSGPLLFVSIGIAVMVLTDCIYSIQSLNETYQTGGLLDIGWILQNLLVWIAAIWQIMNARRVQEVDVHSKSLASVINNIFTYSPYVWLISAIVILINSHFVNLPMSFSQIAAATILTTGLVILRQFINNHQIASLVTEIESARVKIDKQARELHIDTLHDTLTNLPNRALFMDRLDSALSDLHRRSDDPYAVLFLDLDDFKSINDSKGHIVGDELLKEVALSLKKSIREVDTIARLGGDEFLILLEDVKDTQSIVSTTNRILESFKNPFSFDNLNLFITVSIGIVFGIKNYKNSTDILRDADIAMYKAKEMGKSCFAIFDPSMRTKAMDKVILENELRYAIEYHQFRLVYQPIVILKTDQVIAFEALIRWNNPKLGEVMPGKFIPVAEESGLIIDIGDWVLREACSQMKIWQDKFIFPDSISINVNISGLQFSQNDFKDKLKQTLKTTGLPASSLKLEITESVLLDTQQRETNLFNELKKLGVHLQIDDFGTGYSSLSYIQHIPVDVLKIDRSFIRDVEFNEKNLELVRAIVNMAQGMGMETTAEGVETLQQKVVLNSLGCCYGQGFFWAKPMNQEAAEKYMANRIAGY